jgi:hypothetical protein
VQVEFVDRKVRVGRVCELGGAPPQAGTRDSLTGHLLVGEYRPGDALMRSLHVDVRAGIQDDIGQLNEELEERESIAILIEHFVIETIDH